MHAEEGLEFFKRFLGLFKRRGYAIMHDKLCLGVVPHIRLTKVQKVHSLVRGEAHRNSSNLLKPQHHRDSKVWRGLSHEFRVVRLYRTFSIYIIAGETRCAGCLCTSSGWFKHIETHRTYSNHNITEIARCGEVCHMSSGWFNCTEPFLSTSFLEFVVGSFPFDEVRCV